MMNQYKFSIWSVSTGIWVVLLIQSYMASRLAVKAIPYRQFMNSLKKGRVTEIAVSRDIIQSLLKDAQEKVEEFPPAYRMYFRYAGSSGISSTC
jgi:hypothetical protein